MEILEGKTKVVLLKADITTQQVDAIVNAANSALSGGGGVDGAIHRAAGPSVLEECRRVKGGCPVGQAVATGGGDLAAAKVIHAVGPVWYGGSKGEAELLAAAYRSSLRVAMQEGCRSVAFPSISTGAYRYPIKSAAAIAVDTVLNTLRQHPDAFDLIRFVAFSDKDLQVYQDTLRER
jgi:O-acetyl-ADP-ribose deacetylase (regulator of RNase III)